MTNLAFPRRTRMRGLVTRLPTRRRFVTTSMAAAFAALDGIKRPYLSRAADRPTISHGLQSGDVSNNSGVVWARSDRPARMLVEWSTTESFKSVQNAGFVDVLPEAPSCCSSGCRRGRTFSIASGSRTSLHPPS